MRFINIIGACLVVATAAAGPLASASFADPLDPEGFGPLAPTPFPGSASTTPPASASSLLAKEVAVLTSQGISPARAWQAIDVQGKVAEADLSSKLQAAMAGAYAGVWFENAAAKLHVGVTSSAGRRAAEDVVARAGLTAHVTVTPVRSTMAQLMATMTHWNHKLAGLFAREDVSTGLDVKGNAIAVTLSSSVPVQERAALEREAGATSVNVFVTVAATPRLGITQDAKECNKFAEGANCIPSITAGVTIRSPLKCVDTKVNQTGEQFYLTQAECEKSQKPGKGEWEQQGGLCTAGPAAIPEGNKKLRVLLTAGHCIQAAGGEKQEWLATNKEPKESLIGKSGKFVNGGKAGEGKGDFGEIAIEPTGGWQTGNPNIPVNALSAEWKKNAETRYPVKDKRLAVEKNLSCHEGATSGASCGIITKTILNIGGTEGLVEVAEPKEPTEQLIGEGGDSGGPFMFVEANNEVLMEGTYVGRLTPPECVKVANQKGRRFFTSKAICEDLKNLELPTNEGEWERKLKLVYEPLVHPAGGTAQGSLESLKLELLTTANENRTKELEEEEKPLLLPEPTEKSPVTFTGKIGKAILETKGGTKVECGKGEDTGSATKFKLGSFDVLFSECKSVLGKCTGSEDKTAGSILVKGTFHVWYGFLSKEEVLHTALVVLPKEAKFTCGEVTSVTLKGCLAGLLKPTNEKTKVLTAEFIQTKGVNDITKVLSEKSEKISCTLEASVNKGAFEQTGEQLTEELTSFKQGGKEISVEVMA
jgi:hypothetical protein